MSIFLNNLTEIMTKSGITRIEKAVPGTVVLDMNGNESKIVSNTPVDKKTFYTVQLKNGSSITLGEDTIVTTDTGKKKIQDVNKGDFVLHKFHSLIPDISKGEIEWENEYGANAVPIKIPNKMTNDFALWLGIMASKGRYYEDNGYVGVSVADKVVGRIFHDLSLKVFKIKPLVYTDKNGYIQHYFNSRILVRFLKQNLGVNSNFKKVPQQLLEGSVDEQIEFIKGLTLDGYIDQGFLVVYGGISKRFSDFSAMVLRNCGYAIYQQIRKSGQGNEIYYTKIIGSRKEPIQVYALEESKNEGVKTGGFLVKITKEILETKISSSHPSYSALRNLRQRESKTCYNYTLDELGIKYPENDYYVMVKAVKKEKSGAFNIAVESGSMIYNGMVIE